MKGAHCEDRSGLSEMESEIFIVVVLLASLHDKLDFFENVAALSANLGYP